MTPRAYSPHRFRAFVSGYLNGSYYDKPGRMFGMADDYYPDLDALGSYTAAMKAIGDRVKETGIIPECLLGDGEHTQRLLAEREQTHGAFSDNARIAQHLRDFYRRQPGWEDMTVSQREAFDMDATKRARILSGQACHPDHWDDCAGYALLGKRDCDR